MDYYKIQNDSLNSSLIDNTYLSQMARSNASVHTFSFGGNLTRNNLNFHQFGEFIQSTMKASTTGKKQKIKTTCKIPKRFTLKEINKILK